VGVFISVAGTISTARSGGSAAPAPESMVEIFIRVFLFVIILLLLFLVIFLLSRIFVCAHQGRFLDRR
jgi:hypothetical protein